MRTITGRLVIRKKEKYAISSRKINNNVRKKKIGAIERLRGFSKKAKIVSPQTDNQDLVVQVSVVEETRAISSQHSKRKKRELQGSLKEQRRTMIEIFLQEVVKWLVIIGKLTISKRGLRQQSHHHLHNHDQDKEVRRRARTPRARRSMSSPIKQSE